MKILIKLFLLLVMFIPLAANAITFNVVVLPVDILNVCNNYYCFPETSEILADDIIKSFNKTDKIKSLDLYAIRAQLAANQDLYDTTVNVVRKYDYNNSIDYVGLKKIAKSFDAKSVLLVSSVIISDNNLTKRSIWEVLEVSSAFDIEHSYKLKTDAVLLDTVNDIVMWSGSYDKKIGEKSKFIARNASQANSKLDNIRMYFEDIISQDISQNVMLRFFPKTISPLEQEKAEKKDLYKDGSLLQIEKNLPKTKKDTIRILPKDEMEDMIFGI